MALISTKNCLLIINQLYRFSSQLSINVFFLGADNVEVVNTGHL